MSRTKLILEINRRVPIHILKNQVHVTLSDPMNRVTSYDTQFLAGSSVQGFPVGSRLPATASLWYGRVENHVEHQKMHQVVSDSRPT